jgi:Ca2+-binding RTX toxin-like protein
LDFSNISTRLIVMDFSMGEDELFLSESSPPTQTLLDIDQDGEIDDVRIITVSSSTIDLMSLRPETRYLTDADDFRNGTLLNETIVGLSGNDFIFGADGNDSAFGGAGNDRLSGGRGNDALFGEAGNDSMSGDLGDDYLSGGDGNDTLTTDTGNDVAFGGDGDDRIIASTATGGGPQGTDLMFGEAGNDLIELGEALEYVDAGSGNDLVRIMQISGGASLDTLHGGAGIDTLSLVGFATGSLTVNLAWSLMQDQSGAFGAVSGFERIEFGAANDAVVGWTGNPVIDLGAGADWFADFSPAGAAANDTVFGGAGDDAIYGLAGDDTLNGGDGNDFVIGGDGADTLDGGLGADWMAGGAGADVFVFRSNTMFGIPTPPPMPANGFDVVAQFQPGVDKIDLRQLDGNPNVIGFQSLTIGDFAVGSPGRLRWSSPAGQTYTVVEADLNGDAVRDFVFIVYGETNGQVTQVQLSAADFLL